jgi:hypothetical protein
VPSASSRARLLERLWPQRLIPGSPGVAGPLSGTMAVRVGFYGESVWLFYENTLPPPHSGNPPPSFVNPNPSPLVASFLSPPPPRRLPAPFPSPSASVPSLPPPAQRAAESSAKKAATTATSRVAPHGHRVARGPISSGTRGGAGEPHSRAAPSTAFPGVAASCSLPAHTRSRRSRWSCCLRRVAPLLAATHEAVALLICSPRPWTARGDRVRLGSGNESSGGAAGRIELCRSSLSLSLPSLSLSLCDL